MNLEKHLARLQSSILRQCFHAQSQSWSSWSSWRAWALLSKAKNIGPEPSESIMVKFLLGVSVTLLPTMTSLWQHAAKKSSRTVGAPAVLPAKARNCSPTIHFSHLSIVIRVFYPTCLCSLELRWDNPHGHVLEFLRLRSVVLLDFSQNRSFEKSLAKHQEPKGIQLQFYFWLSMISTDFYTATKSWLKELILISSAASESLQVPTFLCHPRRKSQRLLWSRPPLPLSCSHPLPCGEPWTYWRMIHEP